MDNAQQAGRGEGVEWRGQEWSGGDGSGVEGRGGEGRAGQGRVPDCLGGLSRVGISSRSTRPWNGQPPSYYNGRLRTKREIYIRVCILRDGSIRCS